MDNFDYKKFVFNAKAKINENIEMDEAVNPELDSKVLGYIKDLAKFYEYSDQDAVYAIIQSLVRQGLYNPK
jgi:hypothetical protein